MSETRLDEAIDYLVAQLPAVVGPTVRVWDGPTISADSNYECVYVGWSGNRDEDDAAAISQRWADLGNTRRAESIDLFCAVEVSTGDTAVAGRRTRASEILQLVVAFIRANPALGLPGPASASVSTESLRQGVDEARNRVYARYPLTVHIETEV